MRTLQFFNGGRLDVAGLSDSDLVQLLQAVVDEYAARLNLLFNQALDDITEQLSGATPLRRGDDNDRS